MTRPLEGPSTAFRSSLATVGAAVLVLLGGCAGPPPPPLVTVAASRGAVVFEHAGVLDVRSGEVRANQDVLVRDGLIAEVGASGSFAIPVEAARIDGRGATLIPGLVDSHGHVANGSAPPWMGEFPDPDRNLQAYLFAGVTTVLDPADLAPDAFERRDAVRSGALPGPNIYAAGPMLTSVGGHPLPVLDELAPWWIRWYLRSHAVRPLESDEDVNAAIRELAEARADFVKIAVDRIPQAAPRLEQALASAVVAAAHERGLRVVAHVGTLDDTLVAGNAGVDAFMHMVYKEPLDAAGAANIAAFGKPVVATMGVFESYALLGRRERKPTPLERETVAPAILAAFDRIPGGAVSKPFQEYFELLHSNREAWRQNIRFLRMAGTTILVGSDCQSGVFPGAGLHREMALLVEAGMTPAEVLKAATLDAAGFLEKTDDPSFGTVAPGKRADLVLVEDNPVFDITATERIRIVMKDGIVLDRHPLAAAAAEAEND